MTNIWRRFKEYLLVIIYLKMCSFMPLVICAECKSVSRLGEPKDTCANRGVNEMFGSSERGLYYARSI